MRRIGVHTSISGGLRKGIERALHLGCNTMQMFSHNPRGWHTKEKNLHESREFRKLKKMYDIFPVFIHTSYLINLASARKDLIEKSIDMVVYEMNTADEIDAEYVVLHTGSASGESPVIARERIVNCLAEISKRGKWRAGLLLENAAGERGDITSRISELSEIMWKIPGELIAGICIDTCHAFSAGYDLKTQEGINLLSAETGKYIGKNMVRLLHVNDSRGELGSGIDRHEHIGKGKIGIKGIKSFISHPVFADIPIILETPKKEEDDDLKNLNIVRKLALQ
ncbi:MAG: deoxyribonuclease IV [Nitrospirota bacterium]